MGNKNSKEGPHKLSKKRLLKAEYEKYRSFGEPDLSQNWLELFTPTVISDLFTIMNSCSNNQKKAKYIEKELCVYGFEEVGLGTNVYTMANPAYPGVVFKFALDDCGLADNFNDSVLEGLVNDYLGVPRYTHMLARHPSAIVSVQERKVPITTQDRMESFRGSILRTLHKLAEEFLIIDLSPTLYQLNYGIDRNGDWCFIDASDLYPLSNIKEKIRCHKAVGYDDKKRAVKRCGGKFKYAPDFSAVICSRCGMEFLPSEIRPNDKEDIAKMANAMIDGMGFDEREEMRRREMDAILRKRGGTIAPPPTTPTPPGKEEAKTYYLTPDDPDPEPAPSEDGDEPISRGEVREPDQETRTRLHTPFVEYLTREGEGEAEDGGDSGESEESGEEGWGDDGPDGSDDSDPEPDDPTVVMAFEHGDGSEDTDGEDSGEEPYIEYSIVSTDDDPTMPGILMSIHGDYDQAYDESGLPILLTLDGGKTITQVVSAEALRMILDGAIEDLKEDSELENFRNRNRSVQEVKPEPDMSPKRDRPDMGVETEEQRKKRQRERDREVARGFGPMARSR